MKRKNATRSALFTSIVSLLLCVSMLVGTTLAWFTDEVVSGNNLIAAGNLDIELYNDGNRVTESTNLFNGVLWEPGVVDYENFTIKNEGNLALLYDFAINWGEYNQMTEGGYNLTQILKVAMVDGHVTGDRAAAIAAGEAADWAPLDSWSFKGEMTQKGEEKKFALIIYWEPSDNDNNYNVQNGKTTSDGKELYVNLGINLQATQKMHEEDSFGKDYDSLANPWDGSVGEVPKAEENVITITTAAELAAFAESVNNGTTYSGKTVKLGADINLNNKSWIAIGDCESGKYFQGTFDGQGYTIYNLNVDYSTDASKYATAGLFGWVDTAMATVKNVKIDGATVKGSHWVGVIAGYFTGTIENCSVNDATVIAYNLNDDANGDKVGGIVGCLNEHSYLNNNTVTNSTISGNRDIGGIAGSVAASTYEMKNNEVADTTLCYSTEKSYASAGEIVSGRTGYVADNTNVATNVSIVYAIATNEDLAAAINAGKTEIILAEGEFTVDLYNIVARDSLTITGQGADTKLNFKQGQVRLSQFENLKIENCTIGRMVDKSWGQLVFGSSNNAGGNYTISNCIFNGEATQGIYINQTVDATINIEDCIFNGDFGKEGAITIQDNNAVFTVNVNGCEFNNIPATSHGICAATSEPATKVEYGKWNLLVDGKVAAANAAQLANAVANGATDIYLMDGVYENITGCAGKTLTLNGSKNVVLKVKNEGEDGCDYDFGSGGAGVGNITFNGLTIDTTANTGNYKGYAYMKGTFNDCNFVGAYSLNNANDFVFNRCTFDFKNGYFWTWGANSVTFDGCTFNGNSKTILAHGSASTVININNCTFAATEKGYTGSGDNTAVVEMDPTASNTYTINFTGENTKTDSYAGWTRVKDDSTGHTITGVN